MYDQMFQNVYVQEDWVPKSLDDTECLTKLGVCVWWFGFGLCVVLFSCVVCVCLFAFFFPYG